MHEERRTLYSLMYGSALMALELPYPYSWYTFLRKESPRSQSTEQCVRDQIPSAVLKY